MLAGRSGLRTMSTTRPRSTMQGRAARGWAQYARDRQHLLLAARQLGAGALEPLLEVGKQLEDRRHRQAAGPDHRRQHEVLLDVEAGEDAALLGADRDAEPRAPVRGQADQLLALEPHAAG